MKTMTRVLSRNVYQLDVRDLPLDRLTEQKHKKQRKTGYGIDGNETTSAYLPNTRVFSVHFGPNMHIVDFSPISHIWVCNSFNAPF